MKGTTITLDRERRLRYDANALADAEERLGMGLGKIIHQEASFALIRVLLWAGLKHEDRRLTPEAAGTLLQRYIEGGGDLDEIAGTAMQALLGCGLFRGADEGDDPNATTEAAT